ncbi:Nitrogen permease regulator 3 [Neofusicoccum parvum]|uniref:Nitrogen permease regulator 3 n=1 Tax=Neofusicoccum parvum TaxID=310453 RepID=A0ACB5RR87_9PEZI|nr:Nitrogen permease regulator 3 [Neofusicoccum parvum]
MLSLLSNQSPRTYGTIIPSKDHRTAYMDILAWLMRGGWVTQLRTFAWIRVSPEVQAEVAAIMEHEAKDAARAAMQAARERHAALEVHSDDASDRATIASDDIPMTPSHHQRREERSPRTSETASDGGGSSSNRSSRTIFNTSATSNPASIVSTTSPSAHRNSPLHASHSATSLTGLSTSTNSSMPHGTPNTPQRTANSLRHHLHHPPLHPANNNGASNPPTNYHGHPTHAPHNGHASFPAAQAASKDPSDYTPRMIYSPQRANALEARWIEHIRSSFGDEGVEKDVRDLWPALLKYFDGRHALDDIAGREGVKRKRVWSVLGVLRERNVLYFLVDGVAASSRVISKVTEKEAMIILLEKFEDTEMSDWGSLPHCNLIELHVGRIGNGKSDMKTVLEVVGWLVCCFRTVLSEFFDWKK